MVEELISLLTVREPVKAELPSTPKVPLTITCPIKSCLSVSSSPNTFEPLENITLADSSVMFNNLALTVSKFPTLAVISPCIVKSPTISIEPVCVNEPLISTLPLKSELPSTLRLFTIVNSFVCALILNPILPPKPSCNSTSPLCDARFCVLSSKFISPL